jgi:hypothetical protein
MVNQGLSCLKSSIEETGLVCVPSESINHLEFEMYIGALSQEEFERMKQNYADS